LNRHGVVFGGEFMLKAVLFDLGETLTTTADMIDTFQRILKTYGIHRTLEELTAAHIEAGKLLGFEHMKTMGDEYWVKRNAIFLEKLGVFGREDLARIISEQWWDYAKVALHSDVAETLNQLKHKGIKTGIITNGLQTDLEKITAKTGLSTNLFDVLVTVSTICSMKPEKEIFLYALNVLKVAPHEAIFVGDTIEYDYEGAKKAGMKALLIDREDKNNNENVEKIRDLREILAFI
jgi:putative hydrolase of the HAD superfamily